MSEDKREFDNFDEEIKNFIEENLKLCIRENRKDKGTLIGLPYPYTVPSPKAFDEIYYWDTYFTNVGLIKDGKAKLAKNNVDNMLYMVERFGFMPNGNRTGYLMNSQPPFLSEAVRDVFEYFGDKVWLFGAYSALLKEYDFWRKNRISPLGLNCYNPKIFPENLKGFREYAVGRIGAFPKEISEDQIADHTLSCCESGWDLNPRFDFEGFNFAPVDLNSLMYGFEKNMEYFSDVLENDDGDMWKSRAGERLELMNKYMTEKDGIFLDYNFKSGGKSSVFSAASYYTMFCGAATKKQAEALKGSLSKLEAEFGILTCEKREKETAYQWDYPNGWACIQYIVVKGLYNYGYFEDAERIAKKYVALVERVFSKTHNLWEKYNVVEGSINVSNEYDMPPMMGWSAGVYLALKGYLKNGKI